MVERPPGSASSPGTGSSSRSSATRPETAQAFPGRNAASQRHEQRGRAHQDSARARLFGGSAFLLRGRYDTREHRRGIAVQDLLARVVADLRLRQCLPGPVAPKFGPVGAAYAARSAVQPDGRLDRARAERVAIDIHLRLPEARRGQLLVWGVEQAA